MPKRNEQSYMIVKTQRGDVKIDKDGNQFPVDEKKPEVKKGREKKK